MKEKVAEGKYEQFNSQKVAEEPSMMFTQKDSESYPAHGLASSVWLFSENRMPVSPNVASAGMVKENGPLIGLSQSNSKHIGPPLWRTVWSINVLSQLYVSFNEKDVSPKKEDGYG